MAAGLGFKDFTTGEVLTAADVDGYLMQGIWVFASNAARDAAVTAPAEGNFAFTKDTNSLWYYDGAAWVASGATGDIEGVTAGVGISGGGTSGTVTVTNSMATAIDAKGDLIAGTGADTFARLAVGTNGHTLVADSAEATGLKWAAPAGGGKVLQVVQATTSTETLITATSMQDTGITCTITPTLATSKVLVLINGQVFAYKVGNGATGDFQIVRGATAVLVCDGATGYFAFGTKVGASTVESGHIISTAYLDSPATTSATTYKLQAACNQASELDWQRNSNHTSTIVLMEIGA
jgi:hypothetical protein